MPTAAPVRLPVFEDDLTPAQCAYLKRGFSPFGGDLFEVYGWNGRLTLTYLERRALHYDWLWIQTHGPPDRFTSLRYQRFMAYACGVSFRRVSLALERADMILLWGEERGCEVSRAYSPMVARNPENW